MELLTEAGKDKFGIDVSTVSYRGIAAFEKAESLECFKL